MTDIPGVEGLMETSEDRYAGLLQLQAELNRELREEFDGSNAMGREALAKILVEKIEALIDELNAANYELGRIEYGGDVDYEHSEQWYAMTLAEAGVLTIRFHGFSAQVTWERSPGR